MEEGSSISIENFVYRQNVEVNGFVDQAVGISAKHEFFRDRFNFRFFVIGGSEIDGY